MVQYRSYEWRMTAQHVTLYEQRALVEDLCDRQFLQAVTGVTALALS